MNRALVAAVISIAIISITMASAAPMPSQLLNKNAPVVVGHYHLNVSNVEAHKKFWVDTLGGTAVKLGPNGLDAIKFPDVFLILRTQRPTGPTRGTTFDHIGLAAPN